MANLMAINRVLHNTLLSVCKRALICNQCNYLNAIKGAYPSLSTRLLHPTTLVTSKLHTNVENTALIQQNPSTQEIVDEDKENSNITQDIISKVNEEIKDKQYGRLFAVVQVCGKQFKITAEDLIVLEGYWPPTVGDKIRLEKVLLVGGLHFTLIGRPLLSSDLVSVEATVIEKSMSHTKTHFRKKRRKQYMRINFYKSQFTTLRINSIDIRGKINEKKDVEGLDDHIF